MAKTAPRAAFLFDVFSCAIEGGVTYWARVADYHWQLASGDEDYAGFRATLFDNAGGDDGDEETDYGEPLTLNAEVMERGLALLASGPVEGLNEDSRAHILRRSADNDADLDAGAADVIAQAGLFGKVLYG